MEKSLVNEKRNVFGEYSFPLKEIKKTVVNFSRPPFNNQLAVSFVPTQ